MRICGYNTFRDEGAITEWGGDVSGGEQHGGDTDAEHIQASDDSSIVQQNFEDFVS